MDGFLQTTKGAEVRKAWPAGVALTGQRAQRKGVAIGAEGIYIAEGMAGRRCSHRPKGSA